MLKNTGARTIDSKHPKDSKDNKNKSWISKIFSHATARDLKVFVVPGIETARAYGLDLNIAGMHVVDSPRHASVLLIIGELTPAISDAAIIIYAQMMRPRAVLLLTDDNSKSAFDADVVTKISQKELLSGVKQLREIFKQGSFSVKAQNFAPDSLSIIKKYTCPMHPEILQDEPGSCPKCGMTLVVREFNADENSSTIETKQIHEHEHEQHSHHNHKHKKEEEEEEEEEEEKTNNSSETLYTCPMHPEILQDEPGSCPKCGMFLEPVKAQEKPAQHNAHHEHMHHHGEHKDSDNVKTQYTCPMHPEILQDEPGSCPKCGMFLEPVKAQEKPAKHEAHHEHMHHHGEHKDSDNVKTQYTCPMHPEVIQDEPGSCPKCGMFLVEMKAEENKQTSKQEYNHTSSLKADHSKMVHSKVDHSKMDYSKMDHSKMDHSKMDHSEMSFMSMVDVTQDLPRSDDGLQMEWFDLPFGPFFPGLPAGLFLNFTLDGDVVADCQIKQQYPMDTLTHELPMHAGCFLKKVFALNPIISQSLKVLVQKTIDNALQANEDAVTSKEHIAIIEHERIINHLSWFCQFGTQTGMHDLHRKAESLQSQLYKADYNQFIQQKIALNKFVKYVLKIPMLKFRTQGIGTLSASHNIYGPVARSMNLDNDVRSGDAGYQQLNFKPILLNQGDAYSRLRIRALEIQQSLELITQAGLLSTIEITNIDDMTGEGQSQLESARGKISLKMSFDAGKIQSFEISTATSAHIKLLVPLVKQQEVGDALIAVGSLDLLPSEVHK